LNGNGCADFISYRWEGTSRCNAEHLVLKAIITENARIKGH